MWVVLLPVYCQDSVKPVMHGQGDLVIGRGNECGMQILCPDMSRQHCRLRIHDDEVKVCDLQSRNGTFVNGERIREERRLANADVLGLGSTLLVVELRSDEVRQESMIAALHARAKRATTPPDSPA
jgi:pSer/pThr/pTyr-binding forkhead associated (FHA) protein